jgi:hypothetical protein
MNEWAYQAHLQGKKHLKKTTTETKVEIETRVCDICKATTIPVTLWEAHLKGKKHLTNVTKKAKPAEPMDKECALCRVKGLTAGMLQAHLKGQRHAKALVPKAQVQTVSCEVCGVSNIPASHMQEHVKGKKHAKKAKQPQAAEVADKECAVCNIKGLIQAQL